MPKEGSNAFYRAYADRWYLDRANRDTYLARQAAGDVLFSGSVALPALKTVDGVDVSVHAADLDAHTRNMMQTIRTGEYFPPFPIASITASAILADRIWAHIFYVARNLTIDRLAIEITTAVDASTIRLGIYNDGTNLYPGTLVKDAGTVSGAATGVVAAILDPAISLTKGVYFLVAVSASAVSIRCATPAWSSLGFVATSFLAADLNSGWYKDAVGAGALADPFVSGASLAGTTRLVLPRLLTLD